MVFSSLIFLFIFLPCTLIIHWILPARFRNFFLLLASILFYFWGEKSLTLIIIISIAINYLGGILIGKYKLDQPTISKWILGSFIALNLSVLVYFKYAHFIIENLQRIGLFINCENPRLHLPIGISFYTFHIISYLIDVYRRDAEPQKKPADLGLYIFLFPQLVAGPIIRYKNISQKIASRFISGENFTQGAIRFIRGLGKKVIIANTMAVICDKVFDITSGNMPAGVAWIGLIAYTFQIYFDFSGYSDMALGLGKMLGFNFPENFNHPYISRSIQEFWQRWHISLSTWFRDYLYIPLGGNRKGPLVTYRNLFIVFFITGLWHGASWNFIVWGLFHGTFLILERIVLKNLLSRLPALIQHAYTLLIVIVGWAFFRAWNLKYSIKYLKSMFGFQHSTDYSALLQISAYSIFIFIIAIIFSTNIRPTLNNYLGKLTSQKPLLNRGTHILVYSSYILLFLICVMELAHNSYNPFIYYRF
ncbi:MAG: MBOAT family protein [Bacteroidetes bacterium]|nr:MBOAT family protein [Bacteroidota bacterium]